MPENIPTKLIVGLIVAALIGVGIYFWLGTGNSSPMALQTDGDEEGDVEAIDTSEVLAQLNRLQNININTGIFQSDIYYSLEDFGISITEQPIGRENPFVSPAANIQGGIIVPSSTQPTQESFSNQDNTVDEEVSTSTEQEEDTQDDQPENDSSTSSETTTETEGEGDE